MVTAMWIVKERACLVMVKEYDTLELMNCQSRGQGMSTTMPDSKIRTADK